MIKKSRIGNYLKPMLLASVLFVCSCENDEIVTSVNRVTTSDVVTFNINKSGQWTPDVIGESRAENRSGREDNTPSRSNTLPMDVAEGNASETEISMYMIEANYPQEVDTVSVDSRAEGDAPVVPAVGIIGYHTTDDATKTFMDNINLSTYNNNVYWPGSGSLKFYAYSPYIAASGTEENGLQLSVADNQPTFTYQVPTDATKQYDLMDGVTEDIPGNSLQEVGINLYHVMSKIQVELGSLVEGQVESVKLLNIYDKGTRTMGASISSSANTLNNTGWTITTDSKQSYELTFEEGENISIPMYLMPQNLSDDATIEITMSVESDNPYYIEGSEDEATKDGKRTNNYTLSKKLKEFTNVWYPNKTYTYVISTPEEVKVEVSDEVVLEGDYPVKQNLKITNVGLSPCYIRVAMIGSWILEDEINGEVKKLIVADWNPTGDGEFVWNGNEPAIGSTNANNWRKGEDGYYYYMKEVQRGETLNSLFNKYTLKANPPMVDAYLDLEIVVQAVSYMDVFTAWPEQFVVMPIDK